MNKTITLTALAASASLSHAAVLQEVTGPVVATGGGIGTTIISTATDTNDWITTYSNGGTFYVGFDWTINNNAGETGTGGFFGGLALYNGNTERLLIGNSWTSLNYGIAIGGNQANSTLPYTVGQTVRLVAEININDGAANDTAHLWVDGVDAGITYTGNIDDFTQLTHRAGNSPGTATLENLIVTTTLAEAVPEPSSMALLGLGGLSLILRRRK